jgi:hypothetical protein
MVMGMTASRWGCGPMGFGRISKETGADSSGFIMVGVLMVEITTLFLLEAKANEPSNHITTPSQYQLKISLLFMSDKIKVIPIF